MVSHIDPKGRQTYSTSNDGLGRSYYERSSEGSLQVASLKRKGKIKGWAIRDQFLLPNLLITQVTPLSRGGVSEWMTRDQDVPLMDASLLGRKQRQRGKVLTPTPTIRPEIVYVQSPAKKCRVVLTFSGLKYPKDLNHQSDSGSWARKGLTLAWVGGIYEAHVNFGYILSGCNLGHLKIIES